MTRVVDLKFDLRVYSLEAVKKACHRFSASVSFEINLITIDEVVASLRGLNPSLSTEDLNSIALRVKNEVLEQDLRESLRTQTEPVRNLILAHAFSKTGLIEASFSAEKA